MDLQRLLDAHFPMAAHMGVVVEAADPRRVVLRAPLAPNVNHAGTAFGGSLFSVAVLAGWAWVTCRLAEERIDADAVIQESRMRFLAPARGELRAVLEAPPDAAVEKFGKMLRRSGRGRIGLRVEVRDGGTCAARFDGQFAALLRRPSDRGVDPCPES